MKSLHIKSNADLNSFEISNMPIFKKLQKTKATKDILELYKGEKSYKEIKEGMDLDLKAYYNGDLNGFEELGTDWY